MSSPPAGWYPDPRDRRGLRYWSGAGWTDHVAAYPPPSWHPDAQDPHLLRYWDGAAWTRRVLVDSAGRAVQEVPPAGPAAPIANGPATPPNPFAPAAFMDPAPSPVGAPPGAPPAAFFDAAPTANGPATAASPFAPAALMDPAPSPVGAPPGAPPAAFFDATPTANGPATAASPFALIDSAPSLVGAPPGAPPAPFGAATPVAPAFPGRSDLRVAPIPPAPAATAFPVIAPIHAATIDHPAPRESGRSRWRVRPVFIGAAVVLVTASVILVYRSTRQTGDQTSVAPPAAAAAPIPAGYHAAPVAAAGLSLAVPNGWLQLDPASSAFTTSLQRAAIANPRFAPLVTQFRSEAANLKFVAADATNTTFSSNVLMLALPFDKSTLANPAAVKVALHGQFPNADVQNVTVAGTPGLEVVATLAITRVDGSKAVVHSTAFLIPTSKGVVDVDFTTTDDGRQDPVVQTMVHSLTLLP